MQGMYWDPGDWMAGRGHGGRGGRWARRAVWGEFIGEPTPRAERGGVRYLVLDAIAQQPRHGYEIMQAIADRSGGAYKPSPGVVYPTLQMLEEVGHARVAEQDGRRVYAITDEGRKDLEAHRDEVDEFYERSGADAWEDYAEYFAEIGPRIARLFKSVKRAARRGRMTPATMKALRAVLDEAMARVEKILTDE